MESGNTDGPNLSTSHHLPPQDLLIVACDGGALTALAIDVPCGRFAAADAVRLPPTRTTEPWAGWAATGELDHYGRLLRIDPAGRAAALAARRGCLAVVWLAPRADSRRCLGGGAPVFRRAAGGGPSLIRARCPGPGGEIDDIAFLSADADGGESSALRLAVLSRCADGPSTLWVVAASEGAGAPGSARITHRCPPKARRGAASAM